jgi:hypothetical protein
MTDEPREPAPPQPAVLEVASRACAASRRTRRLIDEAGCRGAGDLQEPGSAQRAIAHLQARGRSLS